MSDASTDLEAFRREVAEFLDTAPTARIREAGRKTTSVFAPFDEVMAWQAILYARGWAAPAWPVEHGGTGWTVEQRYVFAEEYSRRDLPLLLPNALSMIGPLLIDMGTDEQRRRYLPGILSGEDYWTQGYSEPGAGSDLASLGCAAVADGDDYIVNGSKIWTTLAHRANRMFMLVRTRRGERKQQGITFLLLDRTDYPGMLIRPIVGLDGVPEQCEVFFDNVRVPQSGRIGAENDGWAVSKRLLEHERGGAIQSPRLLRLIERIVETATATRAIGGGSPLDDAAFRGDVAIAAADVHAYRDFELRAASGHRAVADPAFPSMNKVVSSELIQRLSVLLVRASGVAGVVDQIAALEVGGPVDPVGAGAALVAMPYYLNSRATTIYAGANEVQRDLIARTVQPAVDADLAFSDEQRALRETVASALVRSYDFMAERDPIRRGGDTPALWATLRDLGVLALPFSEASGGLDGTIGDLVAIAEILGERLVVAPYLSSTVLAGDLLSDVGAGPVADRWLPRIVDGGATAALACGPGCAWDGTAAVPFEAKPVAGGHVVSGTCALVLGGGRADVVLVAARAIDDGPARTMVLAVPANRVSRRAYLTIDGRDAADIRLDDIAIDADHVLLADAADAITRAVVRATLVACAESVGAMGALLRETAAYTTERRQFGTSLRGFQAVAHRLADMKLDHAIARATLLRAGAEVASPMATPAALSILKVQVGRLGQRLGEAAIQLHGGMGMTDEVIVGHLHKRLLTNAALFGGTDRHLRLIEEVVLDRPGVADWRDSR